MKKNFMLIGLLTFVLFFVAPMTAEASESAGEGNWRQSANGWWFETTDGDYLADGFYDIDGVTYYFDAAGWMKTGWVYVEAEVEEGMEPYGDWYYFNNSGAMVKGWVQDGADWYYMDPEYGYMWTDSLVGDGTYYVGSNGKMVTDYFFFAGEDAIYAFDANGRRILGGWYQVVMYNTMQWAYIGADGQLVEGWFNDGGSWYYLDEGLAKVGTYIMEYEGQEHLFEFATNGVMVKDVIATKGWIQADSLWYYYGDEGLVKGDWVRDGGAWYWMNGSGVMTKNTTVWDYEAQCYYAVGADGKMVSNGWVELNGSWYYADGTQDGKLVENDWLQLGSTWYYFDRCRMVDEPTFIDEQLNLFSASGAWLGYSNVTNGWVAAYDSWYYLENGQFATGWRWLGAWYYFDEYDYLAAVDGVYYDNNDVPYLFNQDAALTTGWYLSSDDIWYYADAEGKAVVSDWLQLGSTWYYFDYDGWMLEDTVYEVDGEEHIFAVGGAWLGALGEYADGWQYLYGDWYYFEDGYVSYGLMKIDGQIYAFNPKMAANDYWFVRIYSIEGEQLGYGTYLLALDGNGYLVKNQWKYIDELEVWVWFDNQGYGVLPDMGYYY